MIARVRHIEAVLRIDADPFRPVKLARTRACATNATDQLDLRRDRPWRGGHQMELLHPLRATIFADEQISLCIGRDRSRQLELAWGRSADPPLGHELPFGSEMIHSLVMGFNDDNIAIPVPPHALGFAEVGLGHLPIKEKMTIRRELL